MKLYFVKRGNEYWKNDSHTEGLWSWYFVLSDINAQVFWKKADAFRALNNALARAKWDKDSLEQDRVGASYRDSYKVVSLKGEAALKYFILRLDERINKIERTLEDHKL